MNVAVGIALLAIGIAGVPFATWHILAALAIAIVASLSAARFSSRVPAYLLLFAAVLLSAYVQHETLPLFAVFAAIAYAAIAELPTVETNNERARLFGLLVAIAATALVLVWKPSGAIGFVAIALSAVRGARSGDIAMVYGALMGTGLFFFG